MSGQRLHNLETINRSMRGNRHGRVGDKCPVATIAAALADSATKELLPDDRSETLPAFRGVIRFPPIPLSDRRPKPTFSIIELDLPLFDCHGIKKCCQVNACSTRCTRPVLVDVGGSGSSTIFDIGTILDTRGSAVGGISRGGHE
jgi:hypothetical protein